MNLNILTRIQRYLKPYENANTHFFTVIEIAIDTLKNFIEGPYRRNQDVLSRSRVLHSFQIIMFSEQFQKDLNLLNFFPLTYKIMGLFISLIEGRFDSNFIELIYKTLEPDDLV